MVGASLYLTACTARNRVFRRLRRLREPRYLVGTAVAAAYFYFVVFRHSDRAAVGPGASLLTNIAEPLQLIAAAFLLLSAAAAWVLPGLGRALTFSRAEVQFLFTAPVTRRDLVHYAVLRGLVSLLLSSAITTLFLRPGSLAAAWTLIVGLWLVMLAMRLHLMAAALGRRSLAQHGASGWVRQLIPLAVVMGAAAVIGVTLGRHWDALRALPNESLVFEEIRRLATTGAAGAVLWPFRMLARLPLSASPLEFWRNLPPVVAFIVLNYAWVLRSDAAFEEASAEHAEKAATDRSARVPVAKAAGAQPFRLAAAGLPETAILWKNLIQIGRYASGRTLLRVLPLAVALAIIARNSSSQGGVASFVAMMCVPLLFVTVLFGPQMLRNDLRQDLGNLAVLKAWPVTGPALVRGSVLAPTLVLTAVSWLIVAVGGVLAKDLPLARGGALGAVTDRVSFLVAAGLIAPALILVQTLIHNGLAVLFPAWVSIGASRARGLDVMGQRMLLVGGITIALAVSLIPAALFAGGLLLAVRVLTGLTIVVLPALVFAVIIVAECWVGAEVFGRILDRTDVSAVEPVE